MAWKQSYWPYFIIWSCFHFSTNQEIKYKIVFSIFFGLLINSFFNSFLLVLNLLTYRITPSAHPIKGPPQYPSPSHPHPLPPPFPPPLVCFPELGVSHVLSSSLISSLIFSPFFFIPFHYFLYSPNEWDHIMFVLPRLTYFTQHNTLQFHPCQSKWWVFVVSNGWGIFHCTQRPQLLYPFICRWTPRLLPQFGYCRHCC